jgi:hypothetical protein
MLFAKTPFSNTQDFNGVFQQPLSTQLIFNYIKHPGADAVPNPISHESFFYVFPRAFNPSGWAVNE